MPEEKARSRFDFLRSKPVLAMSAVLITETALFHGVPTQEYVPTPPPLEQFATEIGPWRMVRQTKIDIATENLLKADDTLTRLYGGPGDVDLYIAFFKSQRAGVTPHSPKVCLPSNGWTEESSRIISVSVPGESAPIPVNRYIVSHQEDRSLVLYWYQSAHRVIANEYLAKFALIFDALRYRRSDEALIRVIAPISGSGQSEAGGEERAIRFIQTIYQPLKRQMWVGAASARVRPGRVGTDQAPN
jgi:EpsI family protein